MNRGTYMVRKHRRGTAKGIVKIASYPRAFPKQQPKPKPKASKRYAYEGPEAHRKSSLHAAEVAKLKRMRDRHVVRQAKKGIDYWKGEL